jgi:hypothetical protein
MRADCRERGLHPTTIKKAFILHMQGILLRNPLVKVGLTSIIGYGRFFLGMLDCSGHSLNEGASNNLKPLLTKKVKSPLTYD